ncbi:ankyrin repeat and SOCS box protein 3-like [Ptychodera flava]|uniref:ankyrin repeat and SOCS box protein 3-like n=1 Tax=Ptychodera flava TaxID=63121 RepID=UPI00396AA4E3
MDFNETYEDTVSSIGKAARLGNAKLLKKLIKSGKSINVRDNRGWSPLHQAAYDGHTQCIKILCDHVDTDVNLRAFEGGTALYFAASGGHLDAMKVLLNAGADPLVPDNEENAPLLKAVRGNHTECVKLLLRNNANINCQNVDGWSVVHEVAHRGLPQMMKLLISKGADFSLKEEYSITPLFTATQYGKLDCLRILLEAGAEPDEAANDGGTAVFIASQENFLECLKLLCQYGADVNKITNDGFLPIHAAAQLGHYSCLKFLIKRTNRKEAENCRYSPISLAAYNRCFDCIELLVESGYNINTTDKGCNDMFHGLRSCNFDAVSPLHSAVSIRDSEMVRFLLDHGADPNFNPNPCVLCTACFFNVDSSIVNKLLTHGAMPSCSQNEHEPVFDCGDPKPMLLNGPWFTSLTRVLFDNNFKFEDMLFQKCSVDGKRQCFYHWMMGRFSGSGADLHEHRDYGDPDYPDLVLHALDYAGHVSICHHFVEDFKDHPLWPAIQSVIDKPRSLQQQCRLKIRSLLRQGRSYIGEGFIDQLPIPSILRDYIRIK